MRYQVIINSDPYGRIGEEFDYVVFDSDDTNSDFISGSANPKCNEFGELTFTIIDKPENRFPVVGKMTTAYVYRDDDIIFVGRYRTHRAELMAQRTYVFEDVMAVLNDVVYDNVELSATTFRDVFAGLGSQSIDVFKGGGAGGTTVSQPPSRRFRTDGINDVPPIKIPKYEGYQRGIFPLVGKTDWKIITEELFPICEKQPFVYVTAKKSETRISVDGVLYYTRDLYLNFLYQPRGASGVVVTYDNTISLEVNDDISSVRSAVYGYVTGDSDYIPQEKYSCCVADQNLVNTYGLINERVEFSEDELTGTTTAQKLDSLQTLCTTWLQNHSTPTKTLNISAFDDTASLNLGDFVEVVIPHMESVGGVVPVTAIEHNLKNPASDSFTVGGVNETNNGNIRKLDDKREKKLNSTVKNLLVTKRYSDTFSVSGNGSATVYIDIDDETMRGYVPYSVNIAGSGNANVVVRSHNIDLDNNRVRLLIRNFSGTNYTDITATIDVLWRKVTI